MESEKKGSKDSINVDDQENRKFEVYKIYNWKKDRIRPFKNNEIHTSKYNFITFLPKNLFYQFRKMSNLYFLTMSLLQVIIILLISLVSGAHF